MPFPSSPRIPPGPRRRSLLASAAGAALLVGCTDGSGPDTTAADPSADDRARARAARDSEVLAERYDAVIAAHPLLAQRLRPLREEVVRHAEAFGAVRAATPKASPSVSARAAGPGRDSAAVPATEKEALAQLAGAERELADRRGEALLKASGELARLLASVAAAGAAHVYLLTEGDG
ncbi:lipoprotein [Streptomyces viridiviolaceus]|uniref:Lipoprotein n=1 Tax=Streptomyces viridiviolaceus TaxID=68282 RepID=A0ABW2E0V2_9ACTN|nr:hypothetical protein [Streptomyces viridiviolaceus]GHB77383.1 lipoprotein [Streptomyces viridiviolaceus]